VRRAGASLGVCVFVALLGARGPERLDAQTPDTVAARGPAGPAHPDTSKFIKPGAAAWRSFLLPGWGQAAAGHHVAGALFATWEGVTLMMTLRAAQERQYARQSGSANVASKDQQIQDWTVLWFFNHLFAAADAFVAAHLQDFPKELQLETAPGRIGVRLPMP